MQAYNTQPMKTVAADLVTSRLNDAVLRSSGVWQPMLVVGGRGLLLNLFEIPSISAYR